MTLTDFLLARIAEDEAAAKAAHAVAVGRERWWVDGPAANSGKHWVYQTGEKFKDRPIADHIARHDPARVLAECEAKRRQIEHLIRFMEGEYAPWNETQLQIMATVYADHPDYDESWRP